MDWFAATKEIAELLGYPKCCVEEFCDLEKGSKNRKLWGTGYVPCKDCDARYSEEELIANIMKNRSGSILPFPHTPEREIDDIWVKHGRQYSRFKR